VVPLTSIHFTVLLTVPLSSISLIVPKKISQINGLFLRQTKEPPDLPLRLVKMGTARSPRFTASAGTRLDASSYSWYHILLAICWALHHWLSSPRWFAGSRFRTNCPKFLTAVQLCFLELGLFSVPVWMIICHNQLKRRHGISITPPSTWSF